MLKINSVFCLVIAMVYLITTKSSAQVNLVPNPSFEIFDTCPNFNILPYRSIYYAEPWVQPYLPDNSTDYFNSCNFDTLNLGVPYNYFGVQIPRTGNAYAGFSSGYVSPANNLREYLEVELNDSLVLGKKYCVSFFVSFANLSATSIDGFGVYFSNILLSYSSPPQGLLNLTPQVSNPTGVILSDTLNWIEIYGEFYAAGGEKYLTIGNFKNDAATNYIRNTYGTKLYSYYYIDDVSVYLCDSTVGLDEEKISELLLYPNPSRDIVKLKTRNNTLLNGKVYVSNTLGGIVFMNNLSNVTELEIDISKWSNGIYYLSFESVYGTIRRIKLVKGE